MSKVKHTESLKEIAKDYKIPYCALLNKCRKYRQKYGICKQNDQDKIKKRLSHILSLR